MAAGKSTVAQLLAERLDRAVHLRGDTFRRAIVSGRHEMTANPTQEALAQLRLRYELTAHAANAYAAAGYTTIVQDTILGPLLEATVRLYSEPTHLVVLAPSVDAVVERERSRHKDGYTRITPNDLDLLLRTETPRLGHWIDSSTQSPDETVDTIVDLLHLRAARTGSSQEGPPAADNNELPGPRCVPSRGTGARAVRPGPSSR